MSIMRNLVLASIFVAILVLLAFAHPARADLPPADACTAPGQPCNNAGAEHDQAGTCTMSTCTKTVPGPDGGTMSMSYQCNLCKAAQGGSGGAEGAKPPASKDSGCTVTGGVSAGSQGAALVFAGMLGLLRARRRRP